MAIESVSRRRLLGIAAGFAQATALGQAFLSARPAFADDAPAALPVKDVPFSAGILKAAAKQRAEAAFEKPKVELPEPFNNLGYDQYRDIRFIPEKSIWRGEKLDFELQLFAMGWLYDAPVELWIVDEGNARQLIANDTLFALGPLIGKAPEAAPFGFSGFRIHGPINRADYLDEYAVFQGASYLRAVGRSQVYGSSARGLALNTGRPGGEEFPFFRAFWIEKPKPGAKSVVVHALLDSPSTTGAYQFTIQPGETTTIDCDLTLYPRKPLEHAGIAPLTSMFLHGPASPRRVPDFRPEVHDSEGLAIWNGSGELLWRPLTNPKTLQISAFRDKDPKGFGLWQRGRAFADFQDLEARYERRPSVWVETKGSWGEGAIELLEIPVEDEIHDNVVAYWKPVKPLESGLEHAFAYRLHWSNDMPVTWAGARVAKTRIGNAKKPGALLFICDFEGPAVKDVRDLPTADVQTSSGLIANVVVQRNPEISGIRVSFELVPDAAELVELRAVLKSVDQTISETWLFRWTKP